jgi:hypothetical protein
VGLYSSAKQYLFEDEGKDGSFIVPNDDPDNYEIEETKI